jgi:hypothetical protein
MVSFFAGGIMEAAASALSGTARGIVRDGALTALAVCSMLGVVAFCTHELLRLYRFYKRYSAELWLASPPVRRRDEVDDPLLRTLTRTRLVKPNLRFRGQLEAPEEDMQEPQRTHRALLRRARLSSLWRHDSPGDEHGKLNGWLADVTGKRGVFYQYVRMLAMMLMAFITGLGANAESPHFVAISLITVQALLAAYCITSGAAADRLEGNVAGAEALLGAANVLLLYANAQGLGSSTAEADGENATATALGSNGTSAGADTRTAGGAGTHFQNTALIFAAASAVVPLLLSLYDSLVLPLMEAVANRDRKEGVGVLCRNIIALPFVFAATFVSGSGVYVSSAAEVAEDLTDAAMETKLAEAIGDRVEEGVNAMEKATGLDVDGDGDVGEAGDAKAAAAEQNGSPAPAVSGRRGSCRRPLPKLNTSGQLDVVPRAACSTPQAQLPPIQRSPRAPGAP